MPQDQRKQWICTTLDTPDGARVAGAATDLVSMGIADRNKLWKRGTALRVGFVGGTPELQARVFATAAQWLQPGVKLTMVRADPGKKAEIRVAFNPQTGSWSYIGTDCGRINPGQPTMNLGWVAADTREEDFSSVVLHEFGHALGLLHEHNHPSAQIAWNQANVIADLTGPPNNWDQETIEENVFKKYRESKVITTEFDKASIMIYPIPAHWTLSGQSFVPSWTLSDGDKATIRRLYA